MALHSSVYRCNIAPRPSLSRRAFHSCGHAHTRTSTPASQNRLGAYKDLFTLKHTILNGRVLPGHSRQVCKAAEEEGVQNPDKDQSWVSRTLDVVPSLGEGPGSAVLLISWALFVGYALFLSPNLTPQRDSYFIAKLVGLQRDDFQVSTLFTCLFNAMGMYPIIFLAMLQPSAKSGNKIPLWPFTTLSFGLGFLSLGLYFALWKPSAEVQSPPKKQDLEGVGNLSTKGTESTVLAVLVLLVVAGIVGTAAFAAFNPEQWVTYFHLFDESRLVHVSTLDFGLLTAAAPFWMSNDAQRRQWADRDRWLPALSFLPLLGPAIYLVLRPKAN